MTFWINQHVIETKERISQWRTNRTVSASAVVDHVELAGSHTVLGLIVGWVNRTQIPITIVEIQVVLYKKGSESVLLSLLPLERFGRQGIQRTLVKAPLGQFDLRPRQLHSEHIRFISHQSCEIASGNYNVEIQVRDANNVSYTRRTKIKIETRMKYRLTDDWTQTTEKTYAV